MKAIIITFIFLKFVINAGAIDFAPKHLYTEIKKISKCEKPIYKELLISGKIILDTTKGKFFEYINTTPIKYSYIGRVNTCRTGGCNVSNKTNKDELSEFFDYFILFDEKAKIISVQIFNYEATHGQEISVKGWLKQFVGFNAEKELIVGKDIDAISGATISVYGITADVQDKTEKLKKSFTNK